MQTKHAVGIGVAIGVVASFVILHGAPSTDLIAQSRSPATAPMVPQIRSGSRVGQDSQWLVARPGGQRCVR